MTTALEHVYGARGAAVALFSNREGEVLLSGPAGTGKSRGCLEKLNAVMLRHPGARALIVRKTQASLGSTALVTWRRYVITEALLTGLVSFYGGSAEEPPQYRYTNGSTVMIGGMDKATKIMSSEYDLIYVQEAIELTENDWEALTTRLRNGVVPYQQLIADTNPDRPTHWLKQRCDRGQTRLVESRHEDNPAIYTDDGELTSPGATYMARLDSLTGVRKHRLRAGLWVAAEHIVYEDWDPAVHLVDRFEIPQEWTRWWTVDFGYVHPMVIQMWAEDGDGGLWLYRELFHTKRTVDQLAQQALAAVTKDGRWIEPKPRAIICDHDAENRARFEREIGIATIPAKKTVTDGIQAVQVRLRDCRIHLLRDTIVSRDLELVEAKRPTCTAEEIAGYVWAGGDKEAPLKEQDDGCDALRYMVAERDLGGSPRVRFL